MLLSSPFVSDSGPALCGALEVSVATPNELGHVAAQHHHVNQPTKRSKRRGKVDLVAHAGATVDGLKQVDVAPTTKRSSPHLIGEATGTFVLDDPRSHMPGKPEVPGFPGDLVPEPHHTGGHSRDCPLLRR